MLAARGGIKEGCEGHGVGYGAWVYLLIWVRWA